MMLDHRVLCCVHERLENPLQTRHLSCDDFYGYIGGNNMNRIFIPTVNRVDQQITYNGLPDDLKERVTMVVQAWERSQYKYDCNYLVLPEAINLTDRLCLAKTRAIIYKEARNEKYAVLDDDLTFKRRNSKRFTGISNMEKSSRNATHDDIREMFNQFSIWLDDPKVTICGPTQIQNIPATVAYRNNTSMTSGIFVNGSDFSLILDDLPLSEVRYGEDTLFFLSLLTRGYGNRASQEFCFSNNSLTGKLKEGVWDGTTFEEVWDDHKRIAEIYPDFFNIEVDEKGDRVKGGFRGYGKVKTFWAKAYKSYLSPELSATKKPLEIGADEKQNIQTPTVSLEDIEVPGDNQVALSKQLEERIKNYFHTDRANRFQLYVLSSGMRRKYLDPDTQKYSDTFLSWYTKAEMPKLFGSISNFTKYASAGDVVNYVATRTSDPEKYLNQLPVSVGALYELSIILRSDEDAFKICLQFTASRKSVGEPKFEWKTKRPALIAPKATEQKIRSWRQKWENPPPPKAKRTDKRVLPMITVYCSGELLDFDRKTGDKVGCVDLDQVEEFLKVIVEKFTDENAPQFRMESHMETLTSMYFSRKASYDVARNARKGKKDKSDRYV